jgi:hypothetical protein
MRNEDGARDCDPGAQWKKMPRSCDNIIFQENFHYKTGPRETKGTILTG